MMKRAIWILWPSFIVGGLANALFFTLFDPADLHLGSDPLEVGRTTAYTIGFFIFWAFGAACSAFTCFLQRSSADINRLCPLQPTQRPPGCPEREEASS
jgi:cytosine/uracil/thiamine/allantoin permease